MQNYVAAILRDCGIPASIKGYSRLQTAICMAVEHPSIMDHVVRGLYATLGSIYNEPYTTAECCMRHAIELAFTRANEEAILRYTGCCLDPRSGKVTNAEFIAGIAEYIRMHHANALRTTRHPCEANGKRYQFHGWSSIQNADGNRSLCALVEDTLGNMHFVDCLDIHFVEEAKEDA